MGTINKDTKLYFSVSSKPGNFGATLYNKAFQELGINAIYKPLKLERDRDEYSTLKKFDALLSSLQSIGASGLSVSMPFKRIAAKLMGVFGPEVKLHSLDNVNTVVFRDFIGELGHNTDYHGFIESSKNLLQKCNRVVIYGNGCVANTIFTACKQQKGFPNVDMVSRGYEKYLREYGKKSMLINATPIGMDGVEDDVFTKDVVSDYDYVFDVVVKKETPLIKLAKELGKECVNGVQMSLEQLCKQFEIYTDIEPPRDLFLKTLKENGYE